MKFHYAGKFNGDEKSLPQREHEPGAVQFKEPEDAKKLSEVMMIANIIVFLLVFAIICIRGKYFIDNPWGILVAFLCMVPHEFLHAICFKKDVYMYQHLSGGMLFVVGTEDMSKFRFCFMSMLPNIVFGFIPFIIFMINPSLTFWGELGAFSIAAGVGDYMNVFNALTQMPKGSRTYLSGMHSYWYMPSSKETN